MDSEPDSWIPEWIPGFPVDSCIPSVFLVAVYEIPGVADPSGKPAMSTSTVHKHSKLPKLEVPTFNGNVLHWQQFWEQFETTVHGRDGLTNAEKLVYLQQAIRSGSSRTVIEGLSHSGDQYGEAISCLKQRYDQPRLLHQAHVRTIMDTPSLKDRSGKELCRLHDMLQQHLRALKTMKYEADPSLLPSLRSSWMKKRLSGTSTAKRR